MNDDVMGSVQYAVDHLNVPLVLLVKDELHENSALNEKLADGQLQIIGGEYHLATGKVSWIN
ncbi:hypothetical protein J14TS5_18150 [Paenibacillus lautus]|nr:hypothetical protein J14TS5_18150 [Paenibacillus lautus]